MEFIHTLKLNTKLFFLFAIISAGMLITAVIGYINISSMKKNVDALYFGSFIPVTELNHIVLTYHKEVETTIIKIKNGQVSSKDGALLLRQNLAFIDETWASYSRHYKREEELPYIDFTNTALYRTNLYVERVIDACERQHDLSKLSEKTLTKAVESIQQTIDRLIAYEVESARFERRKFIETYDSTVVQIVTLFIAIFIAVLWVSHMIFTSIRKQQQELESTSRKLRQANKKLQNASYTDSLTGLHNRRFFNLLYERELRRAKRQGRSICFMMLDIDHFKQYNDTYGHIEGDNALKQVAKALKETLLRPGDFVFRLGGEEFGVLITDTDPQSAASVAEKLCANVRGMKIPHAGNSASEYVTLSIGVVTAVSPVSANGDTLISTADHNLYSAKEGGRNRYVTTTIVSDQTPQTEAVHAA